MIYLVKELQFEFFVEQASYKYQKAPMEGLFNQINPSKLVN